ncbi:hypothetical protein [Legionella clemsonensis]|uniref:hypothetical protein n=1 Tax=Legionella clemsonensis TaxID=1867846 RepID=UPI0012FD4BEF|nr:hypothetical protein [Legionella clemsonensis]
MPSAHLRALQALLLSSITSLSLSPANPALAAPDRNTPDDTTEQNQPSPPF